jgi:hypothetical protein
LEQDVRRLVKLWRTLDGWATGPWMNRHLARSAAAAPDKGQWLRELFGEFPSAEELAHEPENPPAMLVQMWASQLADHLRQLLGALGDVTPAGESANAEPLLTPVAEKSKPRVPKDEAETRVRDWLTQHAPKDPEKVTIKDVSVGTGVSTGGVCNTAAWTAFQAKREEVRGVKPRAVPLSSEILKTRPDDTEVDPSVIAEQNEDEDTWSEILQQAASSEERARLANLTEHQRQELIGHYRQQRREHTAEGRERSRRS